MIIAKLNGGLGNQMFQYAFGSSLARRRKTLLKIDVAELTDERLKRKQDVPREYDLDIYCINVEFASDAEIANLAWYVGNDFANRALRRIVGLKKSHYREPHFHFAPSMLDVPDNSYIEGYWQSPKYFVDVELEIRRDFEFKEPLQPTADELMMRIRSNNSVCINVRRGDFLTNPTHGFYGAEYFSRGEAIIRDRTRDHEFFVFSDDIDWCEQNLRFEAPTFFVGHRFAGRKFQDYLRLMSACKHFIIPNSSFAWWAVWLNQNPERIVVAPKVWFGDPAIDITDFIPFEWIRI